MLQTNLRQKYGLDDYSPEKRAELVSKSQEAAKGPDWLAGLAHFGAGLAGRDGGAAAQQILNLQREKRDAPLKEFDAARKQRMESMGYDRDLTKAEREDQAFQEGKDPNSALSKSYQEAAIKRGLDPAMASKMNADTLKARLPFLEKEAEQSYREKQDRQTQSNKDRDYNLDKQKYSDSRTDAAMDRELRQKEFDLRSKAQSSTDANEKQRLSQEADKIALQREQTLGSVRGKPTEGQKVVDKEFAKDYNDWTSGGAKTVQG